MPTKVITDTCSALKLLSLGTKLFVQNCLSIGDLVIHPRVFNETKKWRPEKKEKYKKELETLNQLRAATGLRPQDPAEFESQKAVLWAHIDAQGLSVGSIDVEQLASALCFDYGVVTNDGPMAILATDFEISVFTAENVICIAISEGVLTQAEGFTAVKHWLKNGEKRPSGRDWVELEATVCKNRSEFEP